MARILPRFISEEVSYFDEVDRRRKLKPDAPEWAVKEFEEYEKSLARANTPDENGVVDQT